MSENKKPRVLVTYMEAGLGHIVTAQAISDALKKSYSDKLDVIDNYTLRDSKRKILNKYEKFMVSEVNKHSKTGCASVSSSRSDSINATATPSSPPSVVPLARSIPFLSI